MSTVRTTLETVFPKAAGNAVYLWQADCGPRGIFRSDDTDRETGNFETPEQARGDAEAWVRFLVGQGYPAPQEVLILRAQPEVYAVLHVQVR
jgi:hypothetical protein